MSTATETAAPPAKAPKAPTMTILAALNKALTDAFEADPKVIALGEDLADKEGGGIAGVTRGLSTKFGMQRVLGPPGSGGTAAKTLREALKLALGPTRDAREPRAA